MSVFAVSSSLLEGLARSSVFLFQLLVGALGPGYAPCSAACLKNSSGSSAANACMPGHDLHHWAVVNRPIYIWQYMQKMLQLPQHQNPQSSSGFQLTFGSESFVEVLRWRMARLRLRLQTKWRRRCCALEAMTAEAAVEMESHVPPSIPASLEAASPGTPIRQPAAVPSHRALAVSAVIA